MSFPAQQQALQELIDSEAFVKYYIQWQNGAIAVSPAFTLHRYDIFSKNNRWTLRSVIGICDMFSSRKKLEDKLKEIFLTAKEEHGILWQKQGKKMKVFCTK